MNKLLEYHEEVKPPENFTLNIMKEIRTIKLTKPNPILFYKSWGISLIAASVALFIINISGFTVETDYSNIFEKTNYIQNKITLSMDETSNTILNMFNTIIKK